jgi:DNA invertase Pin-like site-specific DNA recombinase
MAQGKFVAYYRVSTAKQGRSGLGLEAQQEAVRSYLNGGHWQLVDEVVEAAVAEHEAKAISTRTKDALAAAKARGTRLGGDRGNLPAVAKEGAKASVAARITKANNRTSDLLPIIEELKTSGAVSLRQVAAGLNAKGIKTARGCEWNAMQVQRVVERMSA